MTTEAPLAASRADAPAPAGPPLVLLVGNPNVGKTTLFNALTGERARVGNYPGVTVERRSAPLTLPDGRDVEVTDVPGCYSLGARSPEEAIAFEAVAGVAGLPAPALAIVVLDATQLARNLYLALQLVELGVPLVVALNMIDEAGEQRPDPTALGAWLGVPCVATDARRGRGLDELRQAIAGALAAPARPRMTYSFGDALRRDADRVAEALPPEWRGSVERDRALALWALSSLDEDDELTLGGPALRERCIEVRRAATDRDLDLEMVETRYRAIDQAVPTLIAGFRQNPPKRPVSERLDRVLLHPLAGFAVFLLVMGLLFQTLFAGAEPAVAVIEDGVAGLQQALRDGFSRSIPRDLAADGLVGGVGNVLVFLPQIALLFFLIGLLEDSGYMARVAYLMDRVMRALGLSGRAFVPMLSGYACAVPAILSTRTMERQRDRLLTMLVVPLMTCSARLPVYTLIIAALFPAEVNGVGVQGALMVGMYLFSTVVALAAAGVLGRTVVKGRRVPLLLELPPYRWPALSSVLRMTVERCRSFLQEAGTVIALCTVVLWALLAFPRSPDPPGTPPAAIAPAAGSLAAPAASPPTAGAAPTGARAAPGPDARTPAAAPAAAAPPPPGSSAIEQSYGGRLGKLIEPAIAPLGFDWRIGIGLVGAFAAREVFVSTLGLVFGMEGLDDEAAPLRERLRADRAPDGKPRYRPLTGLSLMVFFALACQCMSTLAVVYRETRSRRWPAFLFVYTLALAYGASLAVYQVGSALGF